jgi:hypothetical protein
MSASLSLSVGESHSGVGQLGGKQRVTLLWVVIALTNWSLPTAWVLSARGESPAIYTVPHVFAQERGSRDMLLNDGVWTRAEFVGWDSQGLRFNAEEESGIFKSGSFIAWGQPSVMPRQPVLLLVDGSSLAGEISSWGSTEVVLESKLWGKLTVSRDSVRGAVLKPLAGAQGRAGQVNKLNEIRPLDRVWLEGGDWLEVEALSLRRGEEQSLEIEVRLQDSQKLLQVSTERVWGISSRQLIAAGGEKVEPIAWRWVFDDGTVLCVRSWEWVEGAMEITLACGIRIRSPQSSAEVLASKLRGASTVPQGSTDLLLTQPVQRGQVGWIGQDWSAVRNRRPEGGWLQIAGQAYETGLGVVGGNTRVYTLPEGTGRLRVWVGMDDRSPVGVAEVKIFLANRKGEWGSAAIWEAQLRRGDQPGGGEVEFDTLETGAIAINVQTPAGLTPSPLVDWLQVLALPAGER